RAAPIGARAPAPAGPRPDASRRIRGKPPHGLLTHACETETIAGADRYALNVRIWRAPRPAASVVMLHGLISHSAWLAPIAERLAASGVTAICPDRRGSGANLPPRG